MRKIVLVIILVLSASFVNSDTIKVCLYTSSEETSTENKVASYLRRELRSLGDVEVVDSWSDWILMVETIEPTYVSGQKTGGIVCYVNYLRPFVCKSEPYIVYEDSSWVIGPLDELKDLCETIVAVFDNFKLEPYRQNNYKYVD